MNLLTKEYAAKSADYYTCERPEILALISGQPRRVLDVGCAAGGFGSVLKRTYAAEVWGVEPNERVIDAARARLDHVICGYFDRTCDLPKAYFDHVFFNDVLEHMISPEEALGAAAELLAPGGIVIASVPNIRQLPNLWDIVVRGQWTYADCGIMDRTHLRFYTRSAVTNLFTSSGYAVQRIVGLNPFYYDGRRTRFTRNLWRLYRVVDLLPVGLVHDLKYLQFAVIARRG